MDKDEDLVFRRRRAYLNLGDIPDDSLSIMDQNLADMLIAKYDYLDSCISNENFNSSLCNTLVMVLKFILENGPILDNDNIYKEQIDMFLSLFRNILRNHLKSLPYSINLLILRLIEIRACNWIIKPSIEEYYLKKVDKSSSTLPKPNYPNESYRATRSNHLNSLNESTNISCLRTSKSYGDIFSNYCSEDLSSRNMRPVKMNMKGALKDEVVIKNSDSGKVMGIKGRRVHMIEEISDTIISFQKANPGAHERVVQITGCSPDNIKRAKSLIDTTIKQNMSPIPFEFYNGYLLDEDIKPYSSGSSNHSLEAYTIQLENINVKIGTSDPLIGQQLEKFLIENGFENYIKNTIINNCEETASDETEHEANDIPELELPELEPPKSAISYDRDFLMRYKCTECDTKLINILQSNSTVKENRLFR